uniref:Uncharacterized protein n=1 Tax=Amphimedon queenslandica TaxID=400682 RepID=A0A1X7UG66_AMPQE
MTRYWSSWASLLFLHQSFHLLVEQNLKDEHSLHLHEVHLLLRAQFCCDRLQIHPVRKIVQLTSMFV